MKKKKNYYVLAIKVIIVLALLMKTVFFAKQLSEDYKEYSFLMEKIGYYKKNIESHDFFTDCEVHGKKMISMNNHYNLSVEKLKLSRFDNVRSIKRFINENLPEDNLYNLIHPCLPTK